MDSDLTAADREKLDALLREMLPMIDQIETGTYRKKYAKVSHVAHGWSRRIVRTINAVLILQSAGFAGEASPLARSIVEHSVALRWLISDGDLVVAPLQTNHKAQTSKFVKAWRASSGETDLGNIEDELRELLGSLEHDDHGRDHMQQFANRVVAHGNAMDLTTYQAELMSTHATYHSAADYLGDEQQWLKEHHDAGDYRLFSACYLFMALRSVAALFLAPPWQARLGAIRSELVSIDPQVDKSI